MLMEHPTGKSDNDPNVFKVLPPAQRNYVNDFIITCIVPELITSIRVNPALGNEIVFTLKLTMGTDSFTCHKWSDTSAVVRTKQPNAGSRFPSLFSCPKAFDKDEEGSAPSLIFMQVAVQGIPSPFPGPKLLSVSPLFRKIIRQVLLNSKKKCNQDQRERNVQGPTVIPFKNLLVRFLDLLNYF
jgi:hypothetical protein